MRLPLRSTLRVTTLVVLSSTDAQSQIDRDRAATYFKEAADLCARDGGRLLGVSLCGPMVFADPRTGDIVANEPTPDAPRPAALGFANAALRWGDRRWSIYVWQGLPTGDARARRTLLMHELVHRIQPDIGLLLADASNDHLDTVEGRYWLQLEWRALAATLRSGSEARRTTLSHALAFRKARHERFPTAREAERVLEINEGIPQYVATAIVSGTEADAIADAIDQLEAAPRNNATFVRTFPYPAGAAYGVLLQSFSPDWTRRVKASDELAALLSTAAGVSPATATDSLAQLYGGAELRVAEVAREDQRQARIATLRKQFVEGPVVILPNGRSNSFVTNGMMPIPGEGMVYPTFRTTGDWGSAEAELILMAADRSRLVLPGPARVAGDTVTGEGWTVKIASGWSLRPGERPGDLRLVRTPPGG